MRSNVIIMRYKSFMTESGNWDTKSKLCWHKKSNRNYEVRSHYLLNTNLIALITFEIKSHHGDNLLVSLVIIYYKQKHDSNILYEKCYFMFGAQRLDKTWILETRMNEHAKIIVMIFFQCIVLVCCFYLVRDDY